MPKFWLISQDTTLQDVRGPNIDVPKRRLQDGGLKKDYLLTFEPVDDPQGILKVYMADIGYIDKVSTYPWFVYSPRFCVKRSCNKFTSAKAASDHFLQKQLMKFVDVYIIRRLHVS